MAALSFCGPPMPNSPMRDTLYRYWPLGALFLLLVVAWAAYAPGLTGGFLFDDFTNLDALGNDGRVDNWQTFWRYITSGTADPAGRPLSLLSFLLDARDWPANPAPFLRTNLILHLINGGLLFVLLRLLGKVVDQSDESVDAVALLGAGLWLMHPLFLSTVFYVVQRQAMLPATFTLLALIGYGRARVRFARSAGKRGLGWMATSLLLGTSLAMLSKLNGVLLPMLCLVLEWTVFRRNPLLEPAAQRKLSRAQGALLWLPSAVVLVYLGSMLGRWSDPIGTRPWTIGQRLITEARVLTDYLELLFVPRSMSSGLFNDGYPPSLDLLHPITTLLACLSILGLVVLAVRLRHRLPDVSAALLFFFVGHLLESTVVPLELYFEHRNYLPAVLLFWPVARGVCRLPIRAVLRSLVAASLLALVAFTSYQRATLWGDPAMLADLWSRLNPDSPRAQAAAAISDLEAGRIEASLQRLAPLWNQNPYDLQIAFNFINARCAAKGPSSLEKGALAQALRHTVKSELLTHNWLDRAIDVAAAGECPGLTLDDIDRWIRAALDNPVISTPNVRNQDIEPLLAQLALRRHQPRVALEHFNRALSAYPSPDVAARHASILATHGAYQEALEHLDLYEKEASNMPRPGPSMAWVHAKVLERQGYWPREMHILRTNLHAALREQSNQ